MRLNTLSYDFAQAKAEYWAFCEAGDHDLPVFAQPWYLDAVCASPEDWRVILCKENNQIRASFPFAYTKGKYGLWRIHNPWQAPRLGIWIDYGGKQRPSAREAYENRIVDDIVSKLPYYDEFQIAFDARFQNWQQFYRLGFRQTSYYSYAMPKDAELETVIPPQKRKALRALEKSFRVGEDIGPEEYAAFFLESYRKRERVLSYDMDRFLALYQAAYAHQAGRLFACRDMTGNLTAVSCVFYDSRRVYTMFSTYDSTVENGRVLLTLHSMRFAQDRGLDLDHEGSMIPGVADYNRNFGSVKEPYFVITSHSDKCRLLNGLRESARALKNIIKR